MLLHFLTKKSRFFELFNQEAALMVKVVSLLNRMVHEESHRQLLAEDIKCLKNTAKNISQTLFTDLHKVFITPFDRHDIHSLNSELYNAINIIHSTAQRFACYELDEIPAEMMELANISEKAAELILVVINNLDKLDNHAVIIESCVQVRKYESDADILRLNGVAKVLATSTDPIMVIKKQELFTLLESITDRYQQIAYLAEGILLEYS